MTIDLGFAHLRLPGGMEVGIVDVPGHARFMRNMLAGTHGLDAVMLVIAADEGVMPQTREHLEIIDLLEVRRGIAVLSKVDLGDADWLALVRAEVGEGAAGGGVAHSVPGGENGGGGGGGVGARQKTKTATRRVDAGVRVLSSAPQPMRHGTQLLLYTGTVEVGCRVIVLDSDQIDAGDHGWVQLYLDRPIAVAENDRFILRLPSPATTIAGGTLVDIHPRKHSRHDAAARESLERRAAGEVLQEELRKYPRGVTVDALLKATMAPGADVSALDARRIGDWLYDTTSWRAIADRAPPRLPAVPRLHPPPPWVGRP